jgi:hypothetical protein
MKEREYCTAEKRGESAAEGRTEMQENKVQRVQQMMVRTAAE